ncbi:MAG: phospho-sugar mutase [Peptostreptococcaceae bacterium]|nr:phospho-sugar mutase [Peptostreptococcaceae bacterium]MDY5738945.1 phospho-sugar mutase [Anaerovoracaceae bacterium]
MNEMEMALLVDKAKLWIDNCLEKEEISRELNRIASNPNELVEAFGKELIFGTSGMRGIMGYGSNRMNEFVVARASKGLGNYLKKKYSSLKSEEIKVIIAYDTRLNSEFFAEVTYSVLRDMGIKAFMVNKAAPVSYLSYTILKTNSHMGVMITASHNPKFYNGYKVYNQWGYQILDDEAGAILDEISDIPYFETEIVEATAIDYVDNDLIDEFLDEIHTSMSKCSKTDSKSLNIVYTPLNGAGRDFVLSGLRKAGFFNIITVESQMDADGHFTTCPVPNPEKIAAYNEAFKVFDRKNGDIIIATDPDCDRVGVALYKGNMKVLLSGNQLGLLILDYILNCKVFKDGQIITSIVSSPLVDKIAAEHEASVIRTLTGFKHMGEKILSLEKEDKLDSFVFAFEESNGYLAWDFIRDKDGVSTAVLVAEMADYYKSLGMSLLDKLEDLYRKYGTCHDKTKNFFFEGIDGNEKMAGIMDYFRDYLGNFIAGIEIVNRIDYLKDDTALKANVIEYELRDGTRFLVRPSGTEPKLKIYLFGNKDTRKTEEAIKSVIDKFYN